MKCLPIPNGVICYADVLDAEVTDRNGKVWRFDFDPRFGPLVVTKRGTPVANQPGERSPFWPAFEAWLGSQREDGGARVPDSSERGRSDG